MESVEVGWTRRCPAQPTQEHWRNFLSTHPPNNDLTGPPALAEVPAADNKRTINLRALPTSRLKSSKRERTSAPELTIAASWGPGKMRVPPHTHKNKAHSQDRQSILGVLARPTAGRCGQSTPPRQKSSSRGAPALLLPCLPSPLTTSHPQWLHPSRILEVSFLTSAALKGLRVFQNINTKLR